METKITALLVDDEKDSREVLSKLLSRYCPEIEIVANASDVEHACREILRHGPNLVFLDIQMPKADGFSLLKKFEVIPFEVIFVTSFNQYAINAIRFSALDYLLKPIEVQDLKMAVEKAVQTIRAKQNSSLQIVNLLHELEGDAERRIAVHSGDRVKLVGTSEVVYIEADGRYSKIFTHKGDVHVTARNLREFEAYLGEQSKFVRISKSCLINTESITSYSKGDPCIIQLVNGKTFEASRRKKQEVLELIAGKRI